MRVLLVEDREDDALLVRHALRRARGARFELRHVESLDQAERALAESPADIILLDLSLPDTRGLATLEAAMRIAPTTPIVVMTGLDDVEVARRAVQEGAQDYLVKGQLDAALLERSLFHALERARIVAALRESEERYALAVRGANDGLWDWDLRSDRIYYSPRWKEMLGLPEDGFGDAPAAWFERVHPEDLAALQAAIADHVAGRTPHLHVEQRVLHEDGSWRWMLTRGVATRDGGSPMRMAGSQSDLTARKRLEERLRHDALHDGLTGLPNRALFMDRLETTLRRSHGREHQLFAVLFADLDRLKAVNDTMGHGAGDHLITMVGRRLEGCLRPGDTVARVGGDEFALLLDPVSGIEDASQVADRIQESVSQPIAWESTTIDTTASIGIALSSASYVRAEDLLRDADVAMYRAKQAGKARSMVFDGRPGGHGETGSADPDLRHAVERDEIQLWYQPVISMANGKLSGFEALPRWTHPVRGTLPGDQLLALADAAGLSAALAHSMLRASCRQIAQWLTRCDNGIVVSLSLPRQRMSQPGLADEVGKCLEEAGVAARHLRLEISDPGMAQGSDAVVAELARIGRLGVRLALDDFGAAATSLRHLHGLPFETLKIGRSFVAGLKAGSIESEIVGTILTLARHLGVAVIADGVETPEQASQLRALGCPFAQGIWFSPPLDGDAAGALIECGRSW